MKVTKSGENFLNKDRIKIVVAILFFCTVLKLLNGKNVNGKKENFFLDIFILIAGHTSEIIE